MIGSNRLVLGNGIVHVVGAAHQSHQEEKRVRRMLVERALDTLRCEEP
jgi:hypothetical protein